MFFFIPVTGNKFPVTRNIVYFTGKDTSLTDTPFFTGSILPVTGSFSCDMGIFHHVIRNVLPITIQGVQFSCEVWVVLFVYSIFATNVRDLLSKFPVRH